MPNSNDLGGLHVVDAQGDESFGSVADMFLVQQLNLVPFNSSGPKNITLHELENQLSNLLASAFWTCHISPPPQYALDAVPEETVALPFGVTLLKGNAMVTETLVRARLNANVWEKLSMIAVVGGLSASTLTLLLSLQFSAIYQTKNNKENILIDGRGILHYIWLYRNHPELKTLLEQVEYPSDPVLRDAGRVRTTLAGSVVARRESWKWMDSERDSEIEPGRNVICTQLEGDISAPHCLPPRNPKSHVLPSITDGHDGNVDNRPNASPSRLRRMSKEALQAWLRTRKSLSLLSITLHSVLVAIHLGLAVVWWRKLENKLVVSLENQALDSFIYSAVLVFVTQTLFLRGNLREDQTLTATHDSIAAWAGIGSATLQIWNQITVPASILGVLSAFGYLANILVLHITSPALFSLRTFNMSRSVPVSTQGLPAFNLSAYNTSGPADRANALSSAKASARASLAFLPFLNQSTTTLGLHGASYYDVLEINSGQGNVSVDATAFNITCGYLTDVNWGQDGFFLNISGTRYFLVFSGNISPSIEHDLWSDAHKVRRFLRESFQIYGKSWPQVGDHLAGRMYCFTSVDTPVNSNQAVPVRAQTAIFYSTIPILDSNDFPGPWFNIGAQGNIVSAIQLFKCSMGLVQQTAIVDSHSRQLLSIHPEITKNTSSWLPFTGKPYDAEDALVDSRGFLNSVCDPTQTLIGRTSLLCFSGNSVGRSPPSSEYTVDDGIVKHQASGGVSLLQGHALVTEKFIQTRLDIVGGLSASVMLLLLSLQSLHFGKKSWHEHEAPIDGAGILHAIWLYRNHPELEKLMDPIDHPSDRNLREAGMVRTTLVG
ncbi:hypothetical protein B0H13DRAFT_1865824 [Mycena leptocephala]|nr:hypothetical protein B0H13DRAFT_1865824 [Mycena leptocephala]